MPDKSMIKFHDIGQERSRPDITAAEDQTKGKHYPSMTFNEKQLPFLKGKKQGDDCTFLVKAHIKGSREPEEWDDADAPHYDIELKKISDY